MKKLNKNSYFIIVIVVFFSLNMINRLIITTELFNPGMNLFKGDFSTTINAFFGDLGFLIIIAMIIYFIVKKKKTFVLMLSVTTLALSAMVFSLKIYAFYYGTAFSFFNARTFSNSAPILGQQLTRHLWKNLFITGQYVAVIPAIIIIGLFIYELKNKYLEQETFKKDKATNMRAFNILVMGLIMFSWSQIGYFTAVNNTYYASNRVAQKGVQTMGVYNYYINDLVSFAFSTPKPILADDELSDNINAYINEKQTNCPKNFLGEVSCNNAATTNLFEGKTLVILQMESFNNYLINLSVDVDGTEYEVMPYFNKLIKEQSTIYYDNYYSNNGVGKTSDAEFASLTGLSPTGFIVTYYDYVDEYYETLPKLFKEKDYNLYSVNGSTHNFYRRNEVYPMLGFDKENVNNKETLEEIGLYDPLTQTVNGWVDDPVAFEYVTSVLRKENEKQFIFALSTVLHAPYADVDWMTGINPWEDTITGDLGNYLDYGARFDKIFGIWYEQLKAEGLLEDVVFMMYGDHTGGLTMDDLSQLNSEIDLFSYQQYSHNVPFLIMAEGMDLSSYGENRHMTRGQTDLKRTVSNLFGLAEEYHFGVDILSDAKTWTYNAITMDLFSDDFHINIPNESINIKTYEQESLDTFIQKFYRQKEMNDAILRYHYFRLIAEGV
ncbi:MAG TPA: sulfatase-like hydrolase/transferase [Acholeplasma sp.]|nr:sulfatase-like hydrolase/transferase [Acholeplasma sp.]